MAQPLESPRRQLTMHSPNHSDAWRHELAAKVRQHRARRRKSGAATTALSLNFPMEESTADQETSAPMPPSSWETWNEEDRKVIPFPIPIQRSAAAMADFTPEPAHYADEVELAEPVLETPRILYAPEAEQLNFLSSFADIRLDAEEFEEDIEPEWTPRSAPLQQRVVAGTMDAAIVAGAALGFAILFRTISGSFPQSRLALPGILAVCGCLWLVFQYVFLVYGSATPGMRMTELELCNFRGEKPSANLRGWRALASTLSALSLGLGFAWALVDEDKLGWHDRMTQTHLKKA